jgi:histidinol-phosphate/aromatic aminotransferase/cobyric acid decarboxylase-like protein
LRRFFDYYRQFEELPPEEISRELRARRDSERALVEHPALDLSGGGWHEPPHPEIVNAATFALRRAVNAYADVAPLRAAVARAHGVDEARVVVGHGAGELLRAALRSLAPEGEAIVAWPGWGPLPRLAAEAGATPVPIGLDELAASAGRPRAAAEPLDAAGVRSRAAADPLDAAGVRPRAAADPLDAAGASRTRAASDRRDAAGASRRPATFGARTRAVVLARPNDPTGAVMRLGDVRALADSLPARAWLILDEALAGFLPAGEDGLVEHPRVVHVRSFSKAHAMAGFRVGYAIVPDGTPTDPLAPVHGVGAAAVAGALWAVENGARGVVARRAHAARERERLAGGPFGVAPGHGPYAWLETAGRPLAEQLAAQRIFVAPGSAWGDDAHVRVTLRDAAATERLLAALRELA